VIVIARRYDEAIPKIQIGFAQLLCNSGIASYLAMTGKRFPSPQGLSQRTLRYPDHHA